MFAGAIVGGCASVVGGGKFESGAVAGAFTALAAALSSPPKGALGSTEAKLAEGGYDPDFQGADGYNRVGEAYTTKSGLLASTFVNEVGDAIVVYAGTKWWSPRDWIANFRQAFGFESAQYTDGIQYAKVQSGKFDNVRFVGHSLGGGVASAAAIHTGRSAITFNAAGVHNNTLGVYSRANANITSYHSAFDVLQIGNALTPASVPGQRVSLGFAGFHGMGGVLGATGGL